MANQARNIVVGGLLDPETDLVLGRPEFKTVLECALANEAAIICGARQVGKSTTAMKVVAELETSPDWSTLFVDVSVLRERDVETAGGLEEAIVALIRNVSQQLISPESTTIRAAWNDLAESTERCLVVIDELQSLVRFGDETAHVMECLRSLEQARKGDSQLRSVVPVFIVLSLARRLYDPDAGAASRAAELLGRFVRLGPIFKSDEITRQLAEVFESHGIADGKEIAAQLLFQSSGYPVLLMAMARLVIDKRPSFNEEFHRWLVALPRELKTSLLDHSFLDTTERFFEDISLELTTRTSALWLYAQQVLQRPTPYQNDKADHRLLVDSGLVFEDSSGNLDHLGPFMSEYFDVAWARDLRAKIGKESEREQLQTRGPIALVSDRKLLVIATGGTIGMLERDGVINSEVKAEYEELGQRFNLVAKPKQLMQLDSANVGPYEWQKIATEIAENLHRCDGVVVAGGTDTLAFSASAVAMALGKKLNKPIVFTGSQTTADVAWGDARSNLLRACLVACAPDRPEDLPEVVVSFGDEVIRAVRADKRDDQQFRGFESVGYPLLGTIGERVRLNSHLTRTFDDIPATVQNIDHDFATGVVVVTQSPGLVPAFLQEALLAEVKLAPEKRRLRGLIVQSLGAGNIPTEPPYSLLPLIESATENDIPVLLATSYPVDVENIGKYDPPRLAMEAGAIPVANMTPAALAAKFSWALAQLATSGKIIPAVAQIMWTDIVGEVDPTDSRRLKGIFSKSNV